MNLNSWIITQKQTEIVSSEKHLDTLDSENYTGKEPTATVSGVLQIISSLISRNKKVNSFHQ